MEDRVRMMFDFQKFVHCEELDELIARTESRYGQLICDDELELVNAAGLMCDRTEKKE